jgi:hypothetical protein
MKHFKGFGSRFTELHTKLDAGTLFDFAKMKHGSRKNTHVKTMHIHSVVSHGGLMQ